MTGQQIEYIGESLTEPVRLHFNGEEIIEVHTATGTKYYRLPDMTPLEDSDK